MTSSSVYMSHPSIVLLSYFHLTEIKVHFADTVKSLEKLSKEAESLFKRAEETLLQVDKGDYDNQEYCKF